MVSLDEREVNKKKIRFQTKLGALNTCGRHPDKKKKKKKKKWGRGFNLNLRSVQKSGRTNGRLTITTGDRIGNCLKSPALLRTECSQIPGLTKVEGHRQKAMDLAGYAAILDQV